jgi:hypothetical protein
VVYLGLYLTFYKGKYLWHIIWRLVGWAQLMKYLILRISGICCSFVSGSSKNRFVEWRSPCFLRKVMIGHMWDDIVYFMTEGDVPRVSTWHAWWENFCFSLYQVERSAIKQSQIAYKPNRLGKARPILVHCKEPFLIKAHWSVYLPLTRECRYGETSQLIPSPSKLKLNSVAFSPQANYTDRATAACQRS